MRIKIYLLETTIYDSFFILMMASAGEERLMKYSGIILARVFSLFCFARLVFIQFPASKQAKKGEWGGRIVLLFLEAECGAGQHTETIKSFMKSPTGASISE